MSGCLEDIIRLGPLRLQEHWWSSRSGGSKVKRKAKQRDSRHQVWYSCQQIHWYNVNLIGSNSLNCIEKKWSIQRIGLHWTELVKFTRYTGEDMMTWLIYVSLLFDICPYLFIVFIYWVTLRPRTWLKDLRINKVKLIFVKLPLWQNRRNIGHQSHDLLVKWQCPNCADFQNTACNLKLFAFASGFLICSTWSSLLCPNSSQVVEGFHAWPLVLISSGVPFFWNVKDFQLTKPSEL